MFRFVSVLLFATTITALADPIVLWPMPPRPPGISDAEYPVYQNFTYFDSFQKVVDQARSGPVDLLFDGGTVMCYWNNSAAWKRYAGLNAINFAKEHDQIQNLLWRFNHGEFDGLHPKLIVLETGTNNAYGGNSPADIAAGIKLLVDTCRQRCPQSHILLLSLLPCGSSPTDSLRVKTNQVNQLISKFDDGTHVTYLDITGKFLQPDGSLRADRTFGPAFEGVPGPGYDAWADAMQPMIDRYCPKTAASAPTPPNPPITSSEPRLTWPYSLSPPPGVAITCYPQPPIWWVDRYSQIVDKMKQQHYDLIFDGDSITDHWQDTGRDVWAARYGSYKAVDVGISSDGVQNALWRAQNGELDGQDPKLVVLLIGTNNHGADPKGVAAGIKLILNEYETRCPDAHILLLGIFPSGPQPHSPDRDWKLQVNSLLATLDDGKRVTYLYIGDKFLHPDGTLTADIMGDFLHPSPKGYAIWADAIQPVVDKYLPKPAAK
jgi:lysophospholipase L1-like esterase